MKKPILLLQFRPSPTAEHEVVCIKRAMGLSDVDIDVRNMVLPGTKLPSTQRLKNYSGFIFGASSDYNVTDWAQDIKNASWSTKYIFDYALKRDIPTLGICFGHQLIALFLGGEVKRDDSQAEGGVVEVFLNGHSDETHLFDDFSKSFFVASGHKDSVTRLPQGAKNLAYSKNTKNSVFQIKNNIFGIQQHPELDVDGLVWRLSLFPEYMKNRSFEEVKKEFRPMPYSTKFLLNFKKLLN